MVRLIIIAVLAALQLACGIPDIMTAGTYWQRALTYSFFHAGWLHLVVNCIAVWSIFDPRKAPRWPQMLAAYIIAVIVYPLSFRPVIGFSNVLYALLGMKTPPLRSRWWRQPSVIAFIIITVGMAALPRLAATTHIAAFLLGMLLAALRRLWNTLTDDARRYL